ncbi:hypothetical protein ACVRXQ_11975 [Streptococcus panodentis]|uniref:Phage protein n=1 Tax=Streptococcus panodentis TaxID=1581472 RepID=A0ABS5AXA5_9STRE|nr:hypothetical protein [Streptococcus panodentis]MBP2621150.1 hypothetical protein [Streptococcus panodentis]
MSEFFGAVTLVGVFIIAGFVSNLSDDIKRHRNELAERRKVQEIDEEAHYIIMAQEHYAAEQAAKMAEARKTISRYHEPLGELV